MAVLQARGVGKRFGARWVLKDLDLDLGLGDVWRSSALPGAAKPPS